MPVKTPDIPKVPVEPRYAEVTRPVVDEIEAIVRTVPGWSPVDQLQALFQLAYLTADVPGDIVEIGSWCGRSTAVLGLAARRAGNLRVHCVDLFPGRDDWTQNPDGSYSFSVRIHGRTYGGYQDQKVWKEPFERDIAPIYEDHESIYEVFEQTVRRHGLENIVVPYRGDSDWFVQSVDDSFRCRLAFIDGDHSYDAVRLDIRNIDRFLSPGGWICFDDAFSYYDGVNRAICDGILENPDYELGRQLTRKFFAARKKAKR